jgi:spore germination protein (amino acid permease)
MDKFTPKHIVFLILATTVVSLKTYPVIFIGNAGRDSWVALIISSILITVYFLFAAKTMCLVENTTIVDVYQKAVGKVLGNILIFLFIATLFMTLVESACIESNSMHQNILVETPEWYYMLFFIVPAIYVIRKNMTAIMIISIIGIIFIMIAGIHLGLLTTQQKKFSQLFPVFENGITPDFFLSIIKSLGLYGFISIVLPYFSRVDTKRVSLTKYMIIGLVILIQMQIVSITGIFMTFSVEDASSYYYPKLIQTHLVSYFEILEFGELYVMLQILGGWLLKYLLSFQAIILILNCYNLKEKQAHVLTYVISAFVYILAYIITYTSMQLFSLLQFVPWIILINFIIIPTAVFIIYRIKLKGIAKQSEE